MRNRMTISTAVLCMTMLLSACGGSGEDTAHLSEPAVTPIEIEQDVNASADDNSEVNSGETSDNTMDVISEEQAYTAVINYCKATDPEFSEESNAEEHTEYWDVSTNEDGVIVVLYRSYTSAQIRYYIQPVTGEAYVTELVPGIIDEEQETGETFNARDYLVGHRSEEYRYVSWKVPGETECDGGVNLLARSDAARISVILAANVPGDRIPAYCFC